MRFSDAQEQNTKCDIPTVTFTFDDGWRSVYDNAFPILQKSQIKATHYIVSGYLDSFQFPLYMGIEHLNQLQKAGHEIGCHTASHRHLPHEPLLLIESEIHRSKMFLARQGFSVETFAYPFGEYNDDVVGIVKDAGFKAARSTIRGFNDSSTDPMLLRVQAVKSDTSFSEVCSWIDTAQKSGKWLILMFHQIDTEGREWSARPEILEKIVGHVVGKGIKPVTVTEGARMLYQI